MSPGVRVGNGSASVRPPALHVAGNAVTKVMAGNGTTDVLVWGKLTEITDNFNRSDRALTTDGYIRCTDSGVSSSQMGITSNRVNRGGSSTGQDVTDVYIHPTSLSGQHQWVEALFEDIKDNAASGEGHLMFRGNGTTDDVSQGVFVMLSRTGWRAGVGTVADGSDGPTTLTGSFGGTFTTGTLYAEIDAANVLTVKWNGTNVGGGTVTGAPSGTRVGLNPCSFGSDQYLDNFSAGVFV
jgi:hypothetical protein